MKSKQPKFIVINGAYFLHNFDIVWFNRHQDDPTSWVDARKAAKAFTQAQIDKMHEFIVGFQGQYTLEQVS